jgi:Cu/Ag efflux protein CusF
MKLLSPFLALSFLLLTQAGCAAAPDSAQPEAASDEGAHAYTTRGIVRALPNPDQPGSELQIRHEDLPEFRSIDGELVGMKSMTMPFPADASLLEGVAVGDKVSFDFELRWTGSPPILVTRLEVLPADTMLDFEVPTE